MSDRFKDAILIQQGACNPIAVSRVLTKAIEEAHAEGFGTGAICEDAAVRLIAHQLAFLLRTNNIDDSPTEYQHLMSECARLSKEAA